LAEDRDWQHSDGVGTVEAYRNFLAQHAHGKWSEEARIHIEGFSLGSAPRTGQAQPKVTASRTGVNALLLATGPPKPAAAPVAAAAEVAQAVVAAVDPADLAQPAPSEETHATRVRNPAGGYGVQLGAFVSAATADREWQRLQVRFSQELNGLSPRIVVASSDSGRIYRLQAPASGEAQARALCDSLRQQ